MATLQEILNDPQTFEDGIEIEIKGVKTSLGDLRGLSAKQQKELSERLQSAQERERAASEMATKASEIYNNLDQLQKQALDAAKATPKGGDDDDFETNNWWTPVRKRLSERDKKIEEYEKKLENLNAAFQKAAVMFANERWSNQYERVAPRLKKSKDYSDWDMTKVREYATKNQIVDEYGFPSIEKAVSQLTKQDDIEEARREAYEKGRKEAEQRLRLASQARPTSNAGKLPKGKSAVEEMGLDGLGDDVMNDEELMDQLSQAQAAFDPSSLQ